MEKKEWLNLKEGNVIWNELDGYNKVVFYDFEDDPFMISCDEEGNITGNSLFSLSMFDREDWTLIK